MSTFVVSIDTGNALVKAVRGPQDPIVIPNLVAVDRNNILRDFRGFTSRDPLIVEMDDQRWAVGESASDLSKTPRAQVGYARYDSPDYTALVAGVLAEMYPARGGTVSLTFSLPVDAFNQARVHMDRLAGHWSFKARERNLNFDIPFDLMMAIPEGFGTLCYFMLSPDGSRIVDLDLTESRVAVVDIGGYTCDVLTFRELNLTPVYGSVERGVIQIKKDINQEIKHRFNRPDLDWRDIESIMTPDDAGRCWYTHAGKRHEVTDIVEESVWELTRGVLDIWSNLLANGVDQDVVIFTGGGAPLIRPFLEHEITHHGILRAPDHLSHLLNAIGAWRFSTFRANE